MTRRKLDAAWWADAARRYEAGDITLIQGAAEARIDRWAFRNRLVDMGVGIKGPGGHVPRETDAEMMDDLAARYAAQEPRVSLEAIARAVGISDRQVRVELAARGVTVRGGIRPEHDIRTPPRPPACRQCGFLVGFRCHCPHHAANRRGA